MGGDQAHDKDEKKRKFSASDSVEAVVLLGIVLFFVAWLIDKQLYG